MTRAAIYARMSTDKQSADSPADQVARCREYAARQGWEVVEDLVVEDAGISGASRHNRPRLLELVERIAEWDLLLCFDFSRLARDGEDLGWLRNRLRLHKRNAFEVSTRLDLFNVGSKVMGIINEEYLVKLRADTRRGLQGRVERGMFAGGTPYGYTTLPEGAYRRLVVVPEQAVVVRRIFDLYLAGEGFRTIAHRLNAEGLEPPRPRRNHAKRPSWAMTSVRAMVCNPIYRGEYLWNRSEWIKDHETGRRRRFERPASEWIRQTDASWIIVEPERWEEAQALLRSKTPAYERGERGQFLGTRRGAGHRSGRARHLLSGLLECAECSGSFHVLDTRRLYGCAWHRDRGPGVCTMDARIPGDELEGRVLRALHEDVLSTEVLAYTIEQALERLHEGLRPADLEAQRRRLAQVERELENLVRLAAKLGDLEAHAQVLAEHRAERDELLRRLRAAPPPLAIEPGDLRAALEEAARDLRKPLAAAPGEMRTALFALLAGRRMRVHGEVERGYRVEGVFSLALETGNARGDGPGRFGCVVAGGGFEPPTSGL